MMNAFPRMHQGDHSEAESFRDFAAKHVIEVTSDFKWSREEATKRNMRCSRKIVVEDLNDGQIYRGMMAINPFKEAE